MMTREKDPNYGFDSVSPTDMAEQTPTKSFHLSPSNEAERAATELKHGSKIGPYVIIGKLGSGATAIVYRALDETLNREVAVKVVRHDAGKQTGVRFLREMQLMATLSHPNVVAVFAAGEEEGLHFAALELLPSAISMELAKRGVFPHEEALRLIRDAALGLEAAWQRGIVHRDVKPANLLCDSEGNVKVADFGLAKDLSRDLELTAEGAILGTPLYLSPEQGTGKPVDHRSDFYSLGATLFHLLDGRPPFMANTPFAVIVSHTVETPRSLKNVPAAVAQLVSVLLEKDPNDRPQSHRELIEMIDSALLSAGDLPLAQPPPNQSTEPLVASQLAAARAAIEMNNQPRARGMLERIFSGREPGWIQAAFMLAELESASADVVAATSALEAVVTEAQENDERAFAQWSLGVLAEEEVRLAEEKAIRAYRRVLEISGTAFPKTLLEARISALERSSGDTGHD